MAVQFSGSLNLTGSLQISGSINDIYYVDFDQKDTTTAVARLGWDTGEGTLTVGLSGGNLDMPIGVVMFETAFNEDSSSISKGDVVRVSGAQGNRVAITKANNLGDGGSATTLALAAETIGVGAQGKVITKGPLKGINTTAFNEGDMLYLSSTPGGITNIKPQAPFHDVRIGVAQRIHASVGIINIQIQNGYELDEIHDVRITTASLAYNQLIARSGSVWRNETINNLGIAITGSNVFNGNQTITGSLNVSSGITASLMATNGVISGSAQIASFGFASGSFVLSSQTSSMTAGFATYASNMAVTSTGTTTDSTLYPVFTVNSASNGYVGLRNHLSGSYYFDGVTRKLYAETFVGAIEANGSLLASGSTQIIGNQRITGSLFVTGSVTISSGSITMPNRPAFRVVGNASTDRVAVTTLSGSIVTVDYNEGNYYDNTNGLFTAPLSGLYHVYFNGRVGSANSQMQVIVQKNTTIPQLMWEAPGIVASTHFGVSGVVKLAANDTLRATVTVGSVQFDGNDSWGAAYIG